ncbi:TVP38/TMEM64 family protein [Haloferax sp. S1W]|uniref:TVP38/TMEM64 family protein n=1 Tax=Haloferax sp. S1W TaxID=3377110 RepID=UPI0037C63947
MVRLPRLFESPRDRWRTLVILSVVVAAALAGGTFIVERVPILTDPRALRTWLLEFGVLAPLVFVGVQVLQILVAPIPGQALGFASGYLFGAVLGTFYSMVGIVIGTAIAVALSRKLGRRYVERVVETNVLVRFDSLSANHGLAVLFVVFLVPGLPDDAICFAAGLTNLPVRRIVAVAAIGRLPGFLLVNVAGSAAADANGALVAVTIGLLAAASVFGYLYRSQLLGWVSAQTTSR